MRVAHWQSRLIETFESAHGRSFRWGKHDCCQFVARCVEAVTGRDYTEIFPDYRNRSEAGLIISKYQDLKGLLTAAFGESAHPSKAQMGDPVLIDFGRGPQPAVCMGHLAYAPGRHKLEFRETLTASDAWLL